MDDERLIGAMVTALAEPRTPPLDALKRIDSSASAARRRRRIARSSAAAVLVAVVVAAVGVVVPRLSQHAEPTAPPGGRAISSDGRSRLFVLSFTVSYPAPVRLLNGAFTADGRTFEATAYTAYSVDHQSEDLSLPLEAKAGETVYVNALVRPNCAGDALPPAAFVILEMGGWTLTERLAAGDAGTDQYLRQRAKWCGSAARASIYSVGYALDGTVTYTLKVTNTTNDSVKVVSAAFRHGDTVWRRASIILKPGWTEKLQISATGYRRGDPKPWDEGRLTADSEPIGVRSG